MVLIAQPLSGPLKGHLTPLPDLRTEPAPQVRSTVAKTEEKPACLIGKSCHVCLGSLYLEGGKVESGNVTAANKIGPLAGVITHRAGAMVSVPVG